MHFYDGIGFAPFKPREISMKILMILSLLFNLAFAQDCVDCQTSIPENRENALIEFSGNLKLQEKLFDAVMVCDQKKVNKFVRKGANINAAFMDGSLYTYPIFKAVKRCSIDFVKFLVSIGADFKNKREFNDTPVLIPAIRYNAETANYLIKNDIIDINATTSFGKSALMVAIYYGRQSVVKELLSKDSLNLNAGKEIDKKGNALTRAARDSESVMLDLLLSHSDNIKPFSKELIEVTIKHLSHEPSEEDLKRIEKIKAYEQKYY